MIDVQGEGSDSKYQLWIFVIYWNLPFYDEAMILIISRSKDGGFTWETVEEELIRPQLDNPLSWKHAYVYGFDTVAGKLFKYFLFCRGLCRSNQLIQCSGLL